jgi:hypothetical protein
MTEELHKKIDELLVKVDQLNNSSTEKKPKTSRKPNAYNLFMGEYIKNEKKNLGDLYDHKKAFAAGAKEWKNQQKENQ